MDGSLFVEIFLWLVFLVMTSLSLSLYLHFLSGAVPCRLDNARVAYLLTFVLCAQAERERLNFRKYKFDDAARREQPHDVEVKKDIPF